MSRRLWTPLPVIVAATLLTCMLGHLQKAPCRTSPWVDGYQYTHLCYTDVQALYSSEGLSEGKRPYLDHPVEYPVVMGAVMALVGEAVTPFAPEDRPRRFFDLTWVLLTACALVVALTIARLSGRRRWDAAMFSVAPALALHVSTNWDLVAVAFTCGALLCWARRQPVAAGLFLGLGTATKLYPVLFLVPLALLCLRAKQVRSFGLTAFATLLTFAAVTVPVYLTSPYFANVDGRQTAVASRPIDRILDQGPSALAPEVAVTLPDGRVVTAVNSVYRFYDLNQKRAADWDSLWFALEVIRGRPLDSDRAAGQAPHVLNWVVLLSFLVALAGITVLALKARRQPRLPQLLFLTLVAFLLTNKVFSPQFTLWLLPLAVLARPRWRPFLAWQAAEVLLLVTRFFFFAEIVGAEQAIGRPWFVAAVVVRDLVLLGFAALVVRDILRPDRDVVRASGEDDPAGGVLEDTLHTPAATLAQRTQPSK